MPKALKMGRAFLFRLPGGCDIIEALTAFCARNKVHCATLALIGATSEVTIGYYDQKTHAYHKKTIVEELEILSALGNVSLKDGKPFLHVHATMGDAKLRAWGGHLFPGSKVFAAEAHVTEWRGAKLERMPDRGTGLSLWPEACSAL